MGGGMKAHTYELWSIIVDGVIVLTLTWFLLYSYILIVANPQSAAITYFVQLCTVVIHSCWSDESDCLPVVCDVKIYTRTCVQISTTTLQLT